MADKEKAEGSAAGMEKDLLDLTRRMLEVPPFTAYLYR